MILRIVKALLYGVAAFFAAGIVSCMAFTYMVRNSHDGQAGMAAAFGGIYAGGLVGIVTFIVSIFENLHLVMRSIPICKRKSQGLKHVFGTTKIVHPYKERRA